MHKLLMLSILSLAFAGCDTADKTIDRNKRSESDRLTNAESQRNYAPDNSGVNVRDRDADALTPFDQSESQADRTITQHIRKMLIADYVSSNAKNIKVITVEGRVTLRGPVASTEEKNEIVRKVKAIAGVKDINNQLEVQK